MRATTVLSLGIAAATLPPAVAQSDHDPWTKHRSTSVLYAGKEGGHREKEFGAFCQAEHALGVASGTDALNVACRALGSTGTAHTGCPGNSPGIPGSTRSGS